MIHLECQVGRVADVVVDSGCGRQSRDRPPGWPSVACDVVRVRLSFDSIRCHGCGEGRPRGHDCPDCGARAAVTEVDLQYQSRARALESVKRLRQAPGVAPAESPFEMLASPLFESVLDRIENGANAISHTRSTRSDELQEVARDIANLEAWLGDTPELRPLGSFARHVKLAVENLIALFDTTVQILEAPTITEAQQIEPNLQWHADAAADAIWECSALVNRIAEVFLSENPAATWLNLAIGADIASAATRGAAILEDHGLGSGHDDAAVLALMWDLIAGSTSDSGAFWRRVADHYALLAAHQEDVVEVSESDTFARRAADALDDLLHAARLAIIQGDPETQRQQATELLDFGHRFVEQPLKLHLGIACVAATGWNFESTQARDVSALVQVANQQGWSLSPLLGSSDLRNAFAHRDYSVRSDGMIELCPSKYAAQRRPAPVLSLDELCDAVLAMSEACGVMDMAYAFVAGHSVIDPAEGMSPFLIRTVAQGLLEWEEIELRHSDDTVIIEARCTPPVKFAAIGTLAAFVAEYEHLTLRLTTGDDALHEIQMPIQAFNAWSQCNDETPKSAAFQIACHSTLIDGKPAMTAPQARKVLAVLALERLADQDATFSQLKDDLASLRNAAKAIGDQELAKAVASCIGWRANVQAGHRPAGTLIDRLGAIAAEEVQPLSEWVITN